MDGYSVRRTVTIHDINLGVYFVDNESPPLFNLFDVSRLISCNGYLSIKTLVSIAKKEHCKRINTSMSYKTVACDFEGLCNILREIIPEEAADIIITVKEFVNNQYRTLPNPLAVATKINSLFSTEYFSLATDANGNVIRYVTIKGTRWFAVQDVIRSFQQNLSDVEAVFQEVSNENKSEITFQNAESRLCVNETGFFTLLQEIFPATATNNMALLISRCQKIEDMRSKNQIPSGDIIVDGIASHSARYKISKIEGITVVAVRYNKDTVITLYSVKDVAKKLAFDIKVTIAAAKHKEKIFVTDTDIFVDINSLTEIFGTERSYLQYCASLFDKTVHSDIKYDALKETRINCDLALLTREQLEERKVMKERFEPYKTTGKWRITAYENFEVKEGKHVLLCLAKANWDDPNEKITPLFWTSSVGLYVNYSRFGKCVNEVCSKEDCCKATFADIKKFNIKMITAEGIKKVLETFNIVKEPDRVVEELVTAAETFAQQKEEDIKFNLEKYNARRKVHVEEKEVQKDTVEEESLLHDAVISFMGKPLAIAVTVNRDKGAVIYYNVQQLCDIFEVKEEDLKPFNRVKDNEGQETLISVYDLVDAFSGVVDNVSDIVKNLFEITKPTVVKIAESLGMKVKDSNNDEEVKEHEDIMTQLLNSNDGRTYTIGAIILAERFRELLLWIRLNNKTVTGVAGPSNNKLLDTLWKFIDCQTTDQDVSSGFKKQVITVSERYTRLKNLFKN